MKSELYWNGDDDEKTDFKLVMITRKESRSRSNNSRKIETEGEIYRKRGSPGESTGRGDSKRMSDGDGKKVSKIYITKG